MTAMSGRERGSLALELVFVGPVLIFLLLLVAVGGKVLAAKAQVQGAARDAARAAALSRGDADGAATAAARQTLDQKLKCSPLDVSLDPRGGAGPGAPVTATVACTVDVADLGLPGFPGQKKLTVSVVSPVDTYVGR